MPELPATTRTGYTFVLWYNETDGTEAAYETMPDYDVNYIAIWQVNQYTITLDSKGGSSVDPITEDYGTAVSAPAIPTRYGFEFSGWYSDEACTAPYVFTTMAAGDITVYAKWERVYCKVTFVVDDEIYSELDVPYGTTLQAAEEE
jgi:uncharacterized repeat protein (TIGR02543 family)